MKKIEFTNARIAVTRGRPRRFLQGMWGAIIACVSAWNKDPVFGVIGIQSGPRH
jgi:hypothetical protein